MDKQKVNDEICRGQRDADIFIAHQSLNEQRHNGEMPVIDQFDAEQRFALSLETVPESSQCISGLILQGAKKPHDCPAFGTACTPDQPLGATMVSSEGACAAYYHYGRLRTLSLRRGVPTDV